MLTIICGLQGTGKTYVARKIAERTGAELLRTDAIRKEKASGTHYTGEAIQDIYALMFSRALQLLQENKKVVLDATFTRQENRLLAKETAESAGKKFIIVEVTCDENVVEKRIKARISDESDAGFETYLAYKNLFEPVTEDHFNIDNSGSTEQTDKQIVALLTSCNYL